MYKEKCIVQVRAHHSGKGLGLNYGNFTAILKEETPGGSWDVVEVISCETGEEISIYSFSITYNDARDQSTPFCDV